MKRTLSIILALALTVSLIPATFAATRAEKTMYRYVFDRDVRTDFDGTNNMSLLNMECATTNTELSDPWGFNQRCYGSSYSLYDGYAGYGVYSVDAPVFVNEVYEEGVAKAVTGGVGFIFYVDESGTFEPTLDYSKITGGVTCEVYITPYSGTRAANAATMKDLFLALKPEQRIGIIDGYATKTTRTSETFRQVKLEKGCYNLCFVMNGVSDVESWKSTTSIGTGGNAGRYSCGLRVHEFKLNRDIAAHSGTEYTYNTVVEVFDYENMLKESGAASLRDGFRKGTSYGGNPGLMLENLGLADYDAKYSTAASGETLETPAYAMDLTKTAPWGVLAETNKNWGKVASDNAHDYLGIRFEYAAYKDDATPKDQFLALKINVPKRGTYKLSFKPDLTSPKETTPNTSTAGTIYAAAAAPKVYFKKLSEISDAALGKNGTNNPWYDSSNNAELFIGSTEMLCRFKFNDNWNEDWREAATVTVPEAGDYAIIFALDKTCLDPELGNPTITSDGLYQWLCLDGIKLTLATPEAAEEDVFDKKTAVSVGNPKAENTAYRTSSVKVLAADTQGNAIKVMEAETEQTIGKVKNVVAEEIDGYEFLYWARGLGTDKRIASWNKAYSFKAETGAIWLTAVYRSLDDAESGVSVAFYNANGDVLKRETVAIGESFALPALPSLAGFGASDKWVLSGSGAEYMPGETAVAEGKDMLFVANYPQETVETVTVNGKEYKYGEKASITAYKRENGAGAKFFAYWTKNGEVVSFDRTLSFTAWEDCTYTPVYLDYTPIAQTVRKILIGYKNDGENSVAFADFIGLESAVESGILFGGESLETATHKIAKKGNENMLSVRDDVSGDAIGYAILSDGTVVYDK